MSWGIVFVMLGYVILATIRRRQMGTEIIELYSKWKWKSPSGEEAIMLIIVPVMLLNAAFSLSNRRHGIHQRAGDEYAKEKGYKKAIEEYGKETQIWYLRLTYNYNESCALLGMAEAYCQLGDDEKAKEIYETVVGRYTGYESVRAKKELAKFEKLAEAKY